MIYRYSFTHSFSMESTEFTLHFSHIEWQFDEKHVHIKFSESSVHAVPTVQAKWRGKISI